MTIRDWDAASYDRVSGPQVEWAKGVLDRLALDGGETVLDAGCGSGRVTAMLRDRVPYGRVMAVDAAPSMVEQARRNLGGDVDVRQVELTALDLDREVDAVFSNAVFHWVADHETLFERLHAALRPGGRLVAQCGGAGNIASVRQVVAELGETWPGPWTFATPEETTARLGAAGFVEVDTWLHDEPTAIEPGEPMETFLATVILRAHLDRMPEADRAGFVRRVAERLPSGEIDYVRLNILARRGGQPG